LIAAMLSAPLRLRPAVLRLGLLAASGLAACSGDEKTAGGTGGTARTLTGTELRITAPEVALGVSSEWKMFGTYSDGSEEDLSSKAVWTSSNPDVARPSSFTDQEGLLISVGVGRAVISATLGDKSASEWLEVKPAAVDRLSIGPEGLTVGIGRNVRLRTVAFLTDDSTRDVSTTARFTSSDPNVGQMSATDLGWFVPFGQGTTTITAEVDGKTAETSITVTDARIATITVGPSGQRVELGGSLRFTARGVYTDQQERDIGELVSWRSSDPSKLTLSTEGVATGVAAGDVEVIAEAEGVEGRVMVRVFDPGACAYPTDADGMIAKGGVMPALVWNDARTSDGTSIDFRLDTFHCSEQYERYSTVAFIVSAGWCPNCPAYMQAVNDRREAIEAAGGLVVFIEIENRAGAPATNAQAHDLVSREIGTDYGLRVGDGETAPLDRPFGRAVSAVPTAYVVRRRDMRVIADRFEASGELDFAAIAADPERNW
jgi:hypothetical protein